MVTGFAPPPPPVDKYFRTVNYSNTDATSYTSTTCVDTSDYTEITGTAPWEEIGYLDFTSTQGIVPMEDQDKKEIERARIKKELREDIIPGIRKLPRQLLPLPKPVKRIISKRGHNRQNIGMKNYKKIK
jgi:hypothetical protein